jgi:hypothetical protein
MKYYLLYSKEFDAFHGSAPMGGRWHQAGSEYISIFREGSETMRRVVDRNVDDCTLFEIECDHRGVPIANRSTCSFKCEPSASPRPVNGLNMEIPSPSPRCRLKTPKHWGNFDPMASRWILSGGSPFVLGHCDRGCQVVSDRWSNVDRLQPNRRIFD